VNTHLEDMHFRNGKRLDSWWSTKNCIIMFDVIQKN